jgi:hypothetical protein
VNRRQAIWLGVLGLALLSLLVSVYYAREKGIFGGELGALIEAVGWAVPILGTAAAFLGMAGAVRESSKNLAITLINKRASRIAILLFCFGTSAALAAAATLVEPGLSPPIWACEISRELPLAAADARCPGHGGFDRRQSLSLVLRRAGDLVVPRTLLARARDPEARSVFLDSNRGGRCSVSGPDGAGPGEARLELKAECASAGAFEVVLHMCFRTDRTPRLEASRLAEAAELTVIEGESPHELRCADRTGGASPGVRDAGPGDPTADGGPNDGVDGGPGPTSPLCPAWTRPLGPGQSWVFVRVVSDSGLLTHAESNLAVHVTCLEPEGGPEQKARADDPCAVSNYLSTTTRMRIRAEAPGFSSRQDDVAPAECTQREPCTIELPRSLPREYYAVASAGADRMLSASELPAGASATEFAAHVARDAVARARFFNRPLRDELSASQKATGVPVNDQVTNLVEKELGRRCDAACGDDPRLDRAVRGVIRELRRDGDPFLRRSPPAMWRHPARLAPPR